MAKHGFATCLLAALISALAIAQAQEHAANRSAQILSPVGAVPGVHAGWLRPGRSPRRSGEAERRRIPTGACGHAIIPEHWHTSAERMVLVSGELAVRYQKQAEVVFRPECTRTGRQSFPRAYRLVPRQRTVRAVYRFRIGCGRGSGICVSKVEAVALPVCASGRPRPTMGQTVPDLAVTDCCFTSRSNVIWHASCHASLRITGRSDASDLPQFNSD